MMMLDILIWDKMSTHFVVANDATLLPANPYYLQ